MTCVVVTQGLCLWLEGHGRHRRLHVCIHKGPSCPHRGNGILLTRRPLPNPCERGGLPGLSAQLEGALTVGNSKTQLEKALLSIRIGKEFILKAVLFWAKIKCH